MPPDLSPAWTLPFAAILLATGVLPIVAPRVWREPGKQAAIVVGLASPALLFLLAREPAALGHALLEYASFITLLGALYVISAGVLVTGDIPATPAVNGAALLAGAVLANVLGTTGASMLLLRPLLRVNHARARRTHTFVFFIFLVSNVGGCLTPIGDPPLLLGYLAGVPFGWTLRLWPAWMFLVASLLAVYLVIETVEHRREGPRPEPLQRARAGLEGAHNLAYLAVVVAAVALVERPWREAAMLGAAVLSWRTTPRVVHERNHFAVEPMAEVAVLFAAIFVAMVPALWILEARAPALGITRPWQFFVAAGSLSAVLDNAPTYLAFVSIAKGLRGALAAGAPTVAIDGVPVAEAHLVAISLGSVFWGAVTYLGNGPNLLVKALAERAGVRMPGMGGYLAWSAAVLLPLLGCVALLFLL